MMECGLKHPVWFSSNGELLYFESFNEDEVVVFDRGVGESKKLGFHSYSRRLKMYPFVKSSVRLNGDSYFEEEELKLKVTLGLELKIKKEKDDNNSNSDGGGDSNSNIGSKLKIKKEEDDSDSNSDGGADSNSNIGSDGGGYGGGYGFGD